jgi:F-type H+-transporting ATPase subunit delta
MPAQAAVRYARALLEVAVESGQLENWGTELAALARTTAEVAAGSMFAAPNLPQRSRINGMSLIAERLALSYPVRSFALVVARRNRIALLPEIEQAYQRLADERLNRARAALTFALPPSDQEVQRIVSILERLSGKTILPTVKVEPALLGGLVAELEGKTYDLSLANKLKQAEQRLSA